MTIDRARHVGVRSEPRSVDIEAGFLKFFAAATGETDPVHFRKDVAVAAGHPDILAPPTYLYCLAKIAPAERGAILDPEHGIGADPSRVLHGEQAFAYHRPVHAGDRLTLTTTTSDIYAKKGGALEFVVQNTRALNDDGELCVEMRVVAVVRND